MRLILLIMIATASCITHVQAEIYTCKDANGNTIYTDSPGACVNAEEVEVDELPTLIQTKPVTAPSFSGSNVKRQLEEDNKYTELKITSPSNGALVRENNGNLTINFQAKPGLQTRKGHKYVVSMDGKEIYSGTSTITALKNVDRGTHTISAKIVDANGATKINAATVKITLQRFSGLQNQNNTFNDGDPDPDNDPNNNDSSDDDDQDTRNNSFSFPTNTKLPTRPPPPPPPSSN